jgi:putative peptidoglycan lipid II flippase
MSVVGSTVVVGTGAAASRVLGFARDILFAQVLGAGPVADAFLAAFRLPNLVRRVLSEGGLNPALVPVLARLAPEDRARFAGEALAVLGLALAALVALVELSAGLVVLVLAPGLDEPGTLSLAALYTRLCFPLVIGVTLASFVAAVLNHGRRYLVAAAAPLIVNAALLSTLLALQAGTLSPEHGAAWLAGIASLAGLAQLGCVWLALRGDAAIRAVRPRCSPALRNVGRSALLTLVAGGAAQLFIIMGTQAASFLPSGVSWLYYAERIVQLPIGLVAASAGVVLLPELATRHAAGERSRVIAAQNRAVEWALVVAAPAAVGLVVLADPITAILLQRGAFEPEDAAGTAQALRGMSLGLPFAVLGKVLAQTLFSRDAGKKALAPAAAGLSVTALSTFALGPLLGVFGIGLGIAIGFAAHAGLLVRALRQQELWAADRRLRKRMTRIGLASAALGAALVTARSGMEAVAGAAQLSALCLGGGVAYFGFALLLGAVTRDELAMLVKKT